MLVEIDKIVVQDRIRKEFSGIEELAEDIKKNGLINPITINKDYVLLAGERRLRAMKLLGEQKVEVHMMDTKDDLHDLDVEISENNLRRNFTGTELAAGIRRQMAKEAEKARERMESGGVQTFAHGSTGKSRDKAGAVFGVSGEQARKTLFVDDHQDLLSVEDFANWDEGKLSTNKAYQMVKARLKELEAENEDLKSRKPEIVEVEVAVTPPDYDEAKAEAKRAKQDVADYKRLYDDMAEKWKAASAEARKLKEKMEAPDVKEKEHIRQSALSFNAGIANFLEQYGGYVWLMNYIDQIPQYERNGFMRGIEALEAWVGQMKINFNPNGLEFE